MGSYVVMRLRLIMLLLGHGLLGIKLDNININVLSGFCEQNARAPRNTFYIPKNKQKGNQSTWFSKETNFAKRIGYDIVGRWYRNRVKRITNDAIDNATSPMIRRVIFLDIEITHNAYYFENPNDAYWSYCVGGENRENVRNILKGEEVGGPYAKSHD